MTDESDGWWEVSLRLRHVDVPGFAILLAALDCTWILAGLRIAPLGGLSLHPAAQAGAESATSHLALRADVEIAILLASIAGCAFIMGLYQRAFLTPSKLAVRLVAGILASFALVQLLFWLASVDGPTPQALLGVHILAFGGFFTNRVVSLRVADSKIFKRRVFVIGSVDTVLAVSELERARRPAQFVLAGSVSLEMEARSPSEAGMSIAEAWRGARADEIVVAREDRLTPDDAAELLRCRLAGARITSFSAFVERESRRVELSESNAVKMVFSEGSRRNCVSRAVKRIVDVTISFVILIFTLPVTLLAALTIWLGRDGPIFYAQERIGIGGRSFKLLKFRTMRVDAEPDGLARWAAPNDCRVTRVGAFLRRSRIDEIPQLLNVLRGEMSLVGPRPERPAIVKQLSERIPLYDYRHLVPPGISGWAQINYPYGASFEDAVEKTRLDLYYIKNGSIILDLVILLQTIRVVLMAEGSR